MIIVITGPSGSGKTTLRRMLNKEYNVPAMVNVTTREKRPGETDGVDYLFITAEEFRRMRNEGRLLEWVEYSGNHYGLVGNRKEDLEGITVLETDGAKRLKAMFPGKVRIVYLDMAEDIRRKRMAERGDSPEKINERIRWDKKRFEGTGFKEKADIIIDDADMDEAVSRILSLLKTGHDI